MDSKNPTWIQDSKGRDILSYRHMGQAQCEANARLIASAPALLEALEAMLLNRELGEAESQRLGKPRMIEVNDKARAAIRAAKGESK
jgi:hypothetical protein